MLACDYQCLHDGEPQSTIASCNCNNDHASNVCSENVSESVLSGASYKESCRDEIEYLVFLFFQMLAIDTLIIY